MSVHLQSQKTNWQYLLINPLLSVMNDLISIAACVYNISYWLLWLLGSSDASVSSSRWNLCVLKCIEYFYSSVFDSCRTERKKGIWAVLSATGLWASHHIPTTPPHYFQFDIQCLSQYVRSFLNRHTPLCYDNTNEQTSSKFNIWHIYDCDVCSVPAQLQPYRRKSQDRPRETLKTPRSWRPVATPWTLEHILYVKLEQKRVSRLVKRSWTRPHLTILAKLAEL